MAIVRTAPPSPLTDGTPESSVESPRRERTQHQLLTDVAVRWLRRANSAGGHGCQVALSECWGGWSGGELPDAIGWRISGHLDGSVLVEVKVSRADFLADAHKPHRAKPESGVGRWRYYMCPEGLIQPEDLPPKWGLLWVSRRGAVRAIAGPAAHLRVHSGLPDFQRFPEALQTHAFDARNAEREMAMLVKVLQRIPDLESTNKRLRVAENRAKYLASSLDEANRTIRGLRLDSWALAAADRPIRNAKPGAGAEAMTQPHPPICPT